MIMQKTNYFFLFLLLFGARMHLQAQVTKSAYFIGNSVTDAINLNGLDALAESKGNTHNWGRHMIPGAPLSWIWEHPADGFSESPYGLYPNALGNYAWDVLSLQPFDRQLDAGSGDDVPMAANFINRAKTRSTNLQVYVYSRWPRKQPERASETADGWNQLWLQTYTGGYDGTNETADYFVKLTNRLRTNHTDIRPARMVPVGQVFHALNNKMKAGQVPGYSSIWQVYSDGIHMTGMGSYIASVTYFATLYSQTPVGLSVPSQYGTIDPAVARIIQETAWSVVTTEPLSGVSGDTGGTTLKAAETPSGTVAGVNYAYYEGTWSVLPAFGSLTAVKSGNVANFDMSVRNRVDNYAFQYTGYVQVPADGQYTFYTSSDDGSKLYIGTTEVVNNDGLHAMQERSGTIGLRAGKHSITVTFFEATGGEGLTVSYSSPTLAKTTIPASALSSVPPAAANRAPTAVLNATPTSGTAPLVVSFNATGSSDPDAGDFILGYEWDFGDGTPFSNSNAPSHTYTTAGTYTARLRVMDNRNLYSAPVSRTITVSGTSTPPPAGSLLAHEHFNAISGTLHSVTTGTGWGAAWQVQNNDVSVPGYNVTGTASLSYSTLATSGKYAVGGDAYQTGGRALNTAGTGPFSAYLTGGNIGAAGKTLWVSALLRKDAANDEEVSLTLHANTLVTYPNPGLVSVGYFGAASNNGTTRYWSLKVGSTVYRTSTAIATGQTALLALKLDFAATSTAALFVNPASLGGGAPTTAGASATSTTSLAFKSLAFYGGNNFNQGATDEIRFGETYASVTPTATARIGVETPSAARTEVFPNPVTNGSLHVKVYAREAGTAQMALSGTNAGRTLLKDFSVQRGENLLKLNTGTLPSGLYLLSVQQGGQRTVQKVMITR
jgi:PKD repeat protein